MQKMASNYAKLQIGNGHTTTTMQEKKLKWIEKQMKKKREKTMKVGDKVTWDEVYKILTSMIIEQ